jgi:hypothetical protein
VDWYLILTPLLGAALVALLGFTGCNPILGLDETSLVPPLELKVRVPSSLTVVSTRFRWTPPGATNLTSSTNVVVGTDGPDTTVISYTIGLPIAGTWPVACRVTVEDSGGQADDQGEGMFMLDTNLDSVTANFDTSGGPSTNNFKVSYAGAVPN